MSAILRSSTRLARLSQRRCISSSPVSRKDIVQDLYLSELRSYKAPPAAKDAHVGVVKSFHAPSAPQMPSVPADLAADLAAYDAAEPSLAEAPATKAAHVSMSDDTGSGAKEFLAFLEADLPKPEVHH
ncbi:hypothetical protein EW145_g3518 [Phellinidium pouzarii]|uniref:ATP synthase subunit H, mitochondrial n=1 Tax=Phellinidium pouzarii TaxID=167371 RepID=A0A4S4L8C6_9AGAM|nr:hypothetical protein EW145_g3518 [Phellinidium pouzarii]